MRMQREFFGYWQGRSPADFSSFVNKSHKQERESGFYSSTPLVIARDMAGVAQACFESISSDADKRFGTITTTPEFMKYVWQERKFEYAAGIFAYSLMGVAESIEEAKIEERTPHFPYKRTLERVNNMIGPRLPRYRMNVPEVVEVSTNGWQQMQEMIKDDPTYANLFRPTTQVNYPVIQNLIPFMNDLFFLTAEPIQPVYPIIRNIILPQYQVLAQMAQNPLAFADNRVQTDILSVLGIKSDFKSKRQNTTHSFRVHDEVRKVLAEQKKREDALPLPNLLDAAADIIEREKFE